MTGLSDFTPHMGAIVAAPVKIAGGEGSAMLIARELETLHCIRKGKTSPEMGIATASMGGSEHESLLNNQQQHLQSSTTPRLLAKRR